MTAPLFVAGQKLVTKQNVGPASFEIDSLFDGKPDANPTVAAVNGISVRRTNAEARERLTAQQQTISRASKP
jgi:hypothetical protein